MDRSDFLKASLLIPLLGAGAASAAQPADGLDDFIDLFYRKKNVRAAFEKHAVPDYIQHSAGMAQGREAAITTLEPMFARDTFHIEPVRVLRGGNLIAVILDVRVGDTVRAMVVDMYRHDHGKIREHWDVKFEIPTGQGDQYFSGFRA